MAAEPVPERELAALHDRISRDLADLRQRWSGRGGHPRRPASDLLAVAVAMFRIIHALRGLVSSLRMPHLALALVTGVFRRRRSS